METGITKAKASVQASAATATRCVVTSSKYTYVALASDATGWHSVLLVDGKEVARQSGAGTIAGPFWDKKDQVAYVSVAGARAFLNYKGNQYGPYGFVWPPAFSQCGEHFGCVAFDGFSQRPRVVVDGTDSQLYLAATPPVFTDDDAYAYFAIERREQLTLVHVKPPFRANSFRVFRDASGG